MTTITDTVTYASLKDDNHLQKTINIPGVNGSGILIESLSGTMSEASANVTGTAWIIATVDGEETEIARWTDNTISWTPKNTNPAYLAPEGKSVTLQVFLESSSNTSKARMKVFSYTYSYKKVEDPEPEPAPARIQIICKSDTDALNFAEDLKTHIGDREMQIFTQIKSVKK